MMKGMYGISCGRNNGRTVEDLDLRIRELCSKVIAASPSEFQAVLAELRAALREHNENLRKLVVAGPEARKEMTE